MGTLSPTRAPSAHGIQPLTVRVSADWNVAASDRTWQSVGTLSLALAALLAWSGLLSRWPALPFILVGLWAHAQGHAGLRRWLRRHQPRQIRPQPPTRSFSGSPRV